MKNRKGFTLIELIVVMVIIGILVLLATPKFLNYVRMAKLTQIKHDTKVVENLVIAHMAKFNGELPSWAKAPLEDGELEQYLIDGKVYTVMGKILEDGTVEDDIYAVQNVAYAEELIDENLDIEDDFFIVSNKIKKSEIRSRLKGSFIINKEGKGVYIEDPVLGDVEDYDEDIIEETDSIYKYKIVENRQLGKDVAAVVGFKEQYALDRQYDTDENKYHKGGKRQGDISLTGDNKIPEYIEKNGQVYMVAQIGDNIGYTGLDGFEDYNRVKTLIEDSEMYFVLGKEHFRTGAFFNQNITAIELPKSIINIQEFTFANNKIGSLKFYGDDSIFDEVDYANYNQGIFAFNPNLKNDSFDEYLNQLIKIGHNERSNRPSLDIDIDIFTFYNCGLENFEFPVLDSYDIDDIYFDINEYAFAFNNISGTLRIPNYIREVDEFVFYNNKIEKLIVDSGRTDQIKLEHGSFGYNEIEDVDLGDIDLRDVRIGYGSFYFNNLSNLGQLQDYIDNVRGNVEEYGFAGNPLEELDFRTLTERKMSVTPGIYADVYGENDIIEKPISRILIDDNNETYDEIASFSENNGTETVKDLYDSRLNKLFGTIGLAKVPEDNSRDYKNEFMQVLYTDIEFHRAYMANDRKGGEYVLTDIVNENARDEINIYEFEDEDRDVESIRYKAFTKDVYYWKLVGGDNPHIK